MQGGTARSALVPKGAGAFLLSWEVIKQGGTADNRPWE